MLGIYAPNQMPHAILPSSSSSSTSSSKLHWSHPTGTVDHTGQMYSSVYSGPFDTPSKSSTRPFTISPPETMTGSTVAYKDGMNPNFLSGPNLASLVSHTASYKPGFVGSTDPLQYSTNSVHSSSIIHNSKTPDSQRSYVTQSESSSHTKVTSTLSIPDTVRVPQHDLSQLAAEVACLFWFEPGTVINLVEKTYSSGSSPLMLASPLPLSTHVVPTEGFRKWLTSLLQTTQVTQNVIILALLFIYRLKRINPGVVANPGSEFRLMTVALMLGNKFLDDNTYTNKTWAEVSGISVQEVHTMEVEFLSNMRFSLFTTEAQWRTWHNTLSRFGRAISNFIKSQEMASKLALLAPLPSPMKPHSPVYMPSGMGYSGYGSQNLTPILLPQVSSTAVSPIGSLPDTVSASGGGSRKRYLDDYTPEQPAKRHMPIYSTQSIPSMVTLQPPLVTTAGAMRMTLPSLTIPPQAMNLPPMHGQPVSTSRAMAMVYPPVQQHQQQRTPVSQMMIPPIQTSAMSTPSMGAHDPSRQMSPYAISATSSPISANPHASHLSPSYFLGQRSSPYRPVRQVKTLLNPPRAPTSVYNAPRQVGMDHLQYHSLGQPLNERHVGHVPYFHREAWPPTHQPRQWPQLTTQGQYMPSQS